MNNIEKLFNERNISTLTRDILLSQSLTTEEIYEILYEVDYPFDDSLLEDIIARLQQAKELHEKVMIAGDYDADGIMATTILVKSLEKFGINAGFYIPDRIKEGYGLSVETVELAAKKGYTLIITVDNGVVAFDALDRAKDLAVDVIVTDHHKIDKKENYNFDYLLHPDLLCEGYQDLCGAGLSLVLSEVLLKQEIDEFYVYAMVATLADMVSVFGFNRHIIKRGLKVLNEEGNTHIEQLIHYDNGAIDQKTISFQVVPKLNTAGRLADIVNVNNIVRYFLLKDPIEIELVAKDITSLNRKRIDLTRSSFESLPQSKRYGHINVIQSEDIHEGLTGLVANRFLNEYNEPILILTNCNGVLKGSGRAPKGFDLYNHLKQAEEKLLTFGGHQLACGLSFKKEDYNEIVDILASSSQDSELIESEEFTLEIDINEINLKTVEEVKGLAPYGVDFLEPKFKVNVEQGPRPQVMAKRHLKWPLRDGVDLLMFSLSQDKVREYQEYESFEASVDLDINEFRGKRSVSLIIDSLKGV